MNKLVGKLGGALRLYFVLVKSTKRALKSDHLYDWQRVTHMSI